MKKWLMNYLPMWAKETVFAENRKLKKENKRLEQKYRELRAYIDGMEFAVKEGCRQCKAQEKS